MALVTGAKQGITKEMLNQLTRLLGSLYIGTDPVDNIATEEDFVGSYPLAIQTTDDLGSIIEFMCSGNFSCTGTPTLTIRLKAGSVTICSFVFTCPSGVSNFHWRFYVQILLNSLNGTQLIVDAWQAVEGVDSGRKIDITTDFTGSINFTTAQNIKWSAQWSAASASNTTYIQGWYIKQTCPEALIE